MNPEDIISVLKSKKPEIDKMLEKYAPREYDEECMEFVCGKPEYEYDLKAINETIAKPMWDFLDRGGKRWRPALFLMLVEALGGDPEKVKDFVVIPELVHNGTIVIDDIEDKSDLRRGRPAAHILFGEDVAINFGNTMYFLPLSVLLKDAEYLDEKTKLKIYNTYAQEMINISMGQAMDLYWHKGSKNSEHVTEAHYLQMCAFKTGTLARMSAKLAAILAGASDDIVEKAGRYAEAVGVAFQIQDDILNLTATSGKGQFTEEYIGSDITEGKRSLMVIHTLQVANQEDKQRLVEILDEHTKNKEKIREAIEIIKKYESVDYAKQKAREIMSSAWNGIKDDIPESEAKEMLHAFAQFLIERDV